MVWQINLVWWYAVMQDVPCLNYVDALSNILVTFPISEGRYMDYTLE
jgi:hypothetical protein